MTDSPLFTLKELQEISKKFPIGTILFDAQEALFMVTDIYTRAVAERVYLPSFVQKHAGKDWKKEAVVYTDNEKYFYFFVKVRKIYCAQEREMRAKSLLFYINLEGYDFRISLSYKAESGGLEGAEYCEMFRLFPTLEQAKKHHELEQRKEAMKKLEDAKVQKDKLDEAIKDLTKFLDKSN